MNTSPRSNDSTTVSSGAAPARQRWGHSLFSRALAGLAGALVWIAVSFAKPDDEDLRNRIWTVAILGMWLGCSALYRNLHVGLTGVARVSIIVMLCGLGAMTLGSFVEYWILFRFPHQGGAGAFARGLAFMAFLVGVLLTFAPSPVAGIAMLRTRTLPRFAGVTFALLLPLTVTLAFLGPGPASLPLGALSALGLVLHIPSRPRDEATTAAPKRGRA